MSTRGWWRRTGMGVCALMIATMSLGVGQVAGHNQQATQDPVVTPTPVVGSTSGQLQAPPAQSTPNAQQPAQPTPSSSQNQQSGPAATGVDADFASPVLAQGLIYLTGGDVVWQVREVELTESATATGNARIYLQRSGATVIRNDVTGKRAKLEPGEAYFASEGDPYTTVPEGSESSVVWIFEIANNNDVGEGAFYLSPNVPGYGEAVYDFELVRRIVGDGQTAEFEGGVGPSLLVVLSGNVDVAAEDGTASLTATDGLVVTTGASITATGGDAVVVTLAVGPEVGDTPAATVDPQQVDPEDLGPGAGTEETPTETSEPDAAPEEPVEPAQPSDDGAYVTSIQVGALESVGITMYVDGELVFDGWLEAGQWTDFYTGTTFEVYTTSGANTQFQNTCGGEPFWMDQTAGDAYYVLEATAESCAPV